MSNKKRVLVNIFGNEYTIVGDSSVDYIKSLSEKVDGIMKEIVSKNRRYSTTMVAVLTALNLADALYKAEEELRLLTEKHEDIVKEYEVPVKQLDKISKELEALREHYKITQDEYTDAQIEMRKMSNESRKNEEKANELQCELDVTKATIKELQNKLFENQLELLKAKKEIDELKSLKLDKRKK